MRSRVLITSQWLFFSPARKCLKHYRKDDYDDFQWEWMPKLYQLYVCENDLMGNAISHANRVALYGVQIEQEGIWPTAQLRLIAREASLWYSHMFREVTLTAIPMRMRTPHSRWEWIQEGKALITSPLHWLAIPNGPRDLHTFLLWIWEEGKNVYNEIIGKITSVYFSVICKIICTVQCFYSVQNNWACTAQGF